jgi:hypothetical protein
MAVIVSRAAEGEEDGADGAVPRSLTREGYSDGDGAVWVGNKLVSKVIGSGVTGRWHGKVLSRKEGQDC